MQASGKRKVSIILSGAVLAMSVLAPAAYAAETTTTFDLLGGELSISAPTTAALANGTTGDATVAGSLGVTTVDDARGLTAGWTASVISSAFTTADVTIAATEVSYAPGTSSSTGEVTVTSGTGGAMDAAQNAAVATAAVGNNTGSWTPGVTVTLPTNALAGTYSGTITHSVL